MSTPIQNIDLRTIATTTDYAELNSISILNQSTDTLNILDLTHGGVIRLNQYQSVTLTSSTGFVLPTLRLDSSGTISACVITT
jgi:hypothetical protein